MAESAAHSKLNAVKKKARQLLFDEDVEGAAVNLIAWVLQAKQIIQELQHTVQEQQITMHNLLAQGATGQPKQSPAQSPSQSPSQSPAQSPAQSPSPAQSQSPAQSPAQWHNRSSDLMLRQQKLQQQGQQLLQQLQTLHFPPIVTENVTTSERPATSSARPVADISTSGMVCANTTQEVEAALLPVKKEKVSITNASVRSKKIGHCGQMQRTSGAKNG